MKKFIVLSFLIITSLFIFQSTFLAKDAAKVDRSGCCSSHGGVCGCLGNSTRCCDGSISPSCSCY